MLPRTSWRYHDRVNWGWIMQWMSFLWVICQVNTALIWQVKFRVNRMKWCSVQYRSDHSMRYWRIVDCLRICERCDVLSYWVASLVKSNDSGFRFLFDWFVLIVESYRSKRDESKEYNGDDTWARSSLSIEDYVTDYEHLILFQQKDSLLSSTSMNPFSL